MTHGMFKFISSLFTGILLIFVSVAANANPITVTNSTKNILSVRVNGQCSSEYGVIKVLTSRTVNEPALVRLCGRNAAHCLAEFFSSTGCRDRFIGYFYFHTHTGPTGEGSVVAPYVLTIRNFEVIIAQ